MAADTMALLEQVGNAARPWGSAASWAATSSSISASAIVATLIAEIGEDRSRFERPTYAVPVRMPAPTGIGRGWTRPPSQRRRGCPGQP